MLLNNYFGVGGGVSQVINGKQSLSQITGTFFLKQSPHSLDSPTIQQCTVNNFGTTFEEMLPKKTVQL